jgi:DtxR family Mn-dependent transcriptional regulator
VNRLSATEETYIETIDALTKKYGYTGVSEIARALNVTPPSVSGMLKKLSAMGFIAHTPYCPVTLTSKGRDLADFLKRQEIALQHFFELLGIDEQVAKEDACKIEHILHEMTLERLARYVEFIENTYHSDNCITCFKSYLKNMEPP